MDASLMRYLISKLKQESILIVFMFIVTAVLWQTTTNYNERFIKLVEDNIKTNKNLHDYMKSQREIDKLFYDAEMNKQNNQLDRIEKKVDILINK